MYDGCPASHDWHDPAFRTYVLQYLTPDKKLLYNRLSLNTCTNILPKCLKQSRPDKKIMLQESEGDFDAQKE